MAVVGSNVPGNPGLTGQKGDRGTAGFPGGNGGVGFPGGPGQVGMCFYTVVICVYFLSILIRGF